jgi:hypothetical protein
VKSTKASFVFVCAALRPSTKATSRLFSLNRVVENVKRSPLDNIVPSPNMFPKIKFLCFSPLLPLFFGILPAQTQSLGNFVFEQVSAETSRQENTLKTS